MKRIIFLLIVSLFLISCEEKEEVPVVDAECKTDSDCITGGCSGTICQSKDAEPIITTCMWKEEYACYKQIECGCVNGKCQWKETEEFRDCLENKRSSEVIT